MIDYSIAQTWDKLMHNFEDTHDNILTFGIDDCEKVYRYEVDEFNDKSLREKFQLMEEQRRRLEEWLYFTPKVYLEQNEEFSNICYYGRGEIGVKRTELTFAEIANHSSFYRTIKRIFDVSLSLAGIIILSPLMLIISLTIIIDDGFPAIFVQDRNGLYGRVFSMYKFRTMCKNAPVIHKDLLKDNEMNGPAFKMKNDPRVTRVGKILRRTSLDELPQLINIIKGDMSIVGPRPLPTYETEQCTEYQMQRLLMRPGLTCYWQCSGRNDIDFEEWIEMDLQYIREASLLTDLRIILKTFSAVVKSDGAY